MRKNRSFDKYHDKQPKLKHDKMFVFELVFLALITVLILIALFYE